MPITESSFTGIIRPRLDRIFREAFLSDLSDYLTDANNWFLTDNVQSDIKEDMEDNLLERANSAALAIESYAKKKRVKKPKKIHEFHVPNISPRSSFTVQSLNNAMEAMGRSSAATEAFTYQVLSDAVAEMRRYEGRELQVTPIMNEIIPLQEELLRLQRQRIESIDTTINTRMPFFSEPPRRRERTENEG